MRAALAQVLPSLTGAAFIGDGALEFNGVSTDSRSVAAGASGTSCPGNARCRAEALRGEGPGHAPCSSRWD